MVWQVRKSKTTTKPANNPTKSLEKRTSNAPVKSNLTRQRRSKASPSWTDLPIDLSLEICHRLPLKSRYVLGFVCTAWSVFISTTLPPIKPNKPTFPWLLYQLNNSSQFLGFHIPTKLSFSFGPYPELEGKTCIGSQDGWMILADDNSRFSFFNPVSESHVTLPSLADNVPLSISMIKKVVFGSHPQSLDFRVVVVFNLDDNVRYAYFSPRRHHWA